MMNMSYKLFILGGIFAVGVMGVPVARAGDMTFCQIDKPATIRVALVAPTPRSDFSKNMAQLEKFHIDTVNPYGAKVDSHVGGLTSGSIKVEQKMRISGATQSGKTCLWPDHIDVIMRLDQIVYIASEYKQGTCMNASVWEHEHKHVRVDREIINKYRPIFERQVQAAVAKMGVTGPFNTASQQTYQDQMMSRVSAAVSVVTKQMESERNKRQQDVDTLEEYERVSQVCRGKK